MDAGIINPVQCFDGARQLAFKRAQVIQVLGEGGGAQTVTLIKNLVAHAAAGGQAIGRQLHAHLAGFFFRNLNGRAVALELVGDFVGLKALDDYLPLRVEPLVQGNKGAIGYPAGSQNQAAR